MLWKIGQPLVSAAETSFQDICCTTTAITPTRDHPYHTNELLMEEKRQKGAFPSPSRDILQPPRTIVGKGLSYKLKTLFLMPEVFQSAVLPRQALTTSLSVLLSLKKNPSMISNNFSAASPRISSIITVTKSAGGHKQGQREKQKNKEQFYHPSSVSRPGKIGPEHGRSAQGRFFQCILLFFVLAPCCFLNLSNFCCCPNLERGICPFEQGGVKSYQTSWVRFCNSFA